MASIASTYPVYLNNVQFEPFKQWDVTYNDSVTTHETEGGTQEDVTTRKGRRTIAVSTTCLESVARQLAALQDLDSFEAKFYELKTDAYATITVRILPSSFKAGLKEKTANLEYCKGIWNVSFTLGEF